METKICNTCGEEKPLILKFWYRDNSCKDGFRGKCKQCKESERIQYFEEHKEEISKLTKVCTKCNKELPATEEFFEKVIKGKYGLRSYCKECKSKYQKKHQQAIKNGSYVRQEEILCLTKTCVICNKELPNTNEYFFKNNKGERDKDKTFKLNAKCKECSKRKFDKVKYLKRMRLKYQKRQATKKGLDSSLTYDQWIQIKAAFNNKCAYCGQELPLQQEHFIAVSKNGEYTLNNIIPACQPCNGSKSNKDFFEWYPQQPFYSKKREKFILDYLNYDKENKAQQLALDSAFFIAI